MTADVVLTLGLAAGPAEAGARVVKRALDQIGAGATAATGAMKQLEAATRGAGVAHAALGKSAGEALKDSLDLGRRLGTYVKDLLRDQTAIRDAIRKTRSDLGDARRSTDELGRSARNVGASLGAGFGQGSSALARLAQQAKQFAQQFASGFVIRAVFQPMLGQGLGTLAGRALSTLLGGGGARGGFGLDPMSLIFSPQALRGTKESPPLGFLKNILGDSSQWLANTFPSVFSAGGFSSGAIAASEAAVIAEGGLSGVFGAAGAFAPNLLATALPMVAAIALPFILKGLFAKKPSVGPNANATVGRLPSGALGIVDSGADNGGNRQAAIDLAETSLKALTKTLRQIGATLADVSSVAGLQVGYFKGKYFVDDTRLGGSATYEQNQFENAEAAVADFVRRALNKANLAGISETMRTVLQNTKARSFEELGRDIDFARDYERDFQPLDAAKAQIEALNRRFDDLRDTARELGLDIGKVDQAFARERQKLTEDFDREVASGILDKSIVGFRKLAEDAETRLEQSYTLGADLGAVERKNYYEKRALLLQLGEEERKVFLGLLSLAEKAEFAVLEALEKMGTATKTLEGALTGAIAASRQAAGSYRQLSESLRDTASAIRLSELSLLSTADKFAELRRQYETARDAAKTGDQDAARRLGGLGRSVLEMGRQFYGASPEYSALYQEVIGTLGDTAAIQDGIAFRLDAHTVLLDAQLQVLREIDKRLQKSQDAVDVLDYLDLTLTRQGSLSEFDRAVTRGEVDRLKELSAGTLPATKADFDQTIARIEGRTADDSLSEAEARLNQADVDHLRLLFFETLQQQVGSESDAARAFDLLKGAIDASASSSESLAARLKSLGKVFGDLKDIFGGAQSPLADPAALQALTGNLANLLKEVGTVVPGDAGGVFDAIRGFIDNLPATFDDVERIDLDAVATGLEAIGAEIEALSAGPSMARLPGDLVEQRNAFRDLGDYLDQAGLAPTIGELVGSLDALAGAGGGGALVSLRTALADLSAPTADLVDAIGGFDTAIAALIATIRSGNGLGTRQMPEIDRSALTGSARAQFDTLAGRAADYVGRGIQAGFSESALKATPSWTWAIAERDRIIRSLSTAGDVESLLDTYYGGQRQIVANADDQGANRLVERLAELGSSGGPAAGTGMAAAYRQFLQIHGQMYGPEGEYYGVAEPDSYTAFQAVTGQARTGHAPPWYGTWERWWNAGHVMADLDKYALGGVVTSPMLFGYGGRLGLMGEAGAEAILPLRRGRDGRLGVAANGNAPADPGLMADLIGELRALRQEVADLRRQQAGEHRESIGQGALVAHRLGGRRAAAGGRA